MMRYKLVVLFCIFTIVLVCGQSSFLNNQDGILISLKQTSDEAVKTIRLQVINDDIIHVMASPSDSLSDEPSLIASYTETKKDGWQAFQPNDNIEMESISS